MNYQENYENCLLLSNEGRTDEVLKMTDEVIRIKGDDGEVITWKIRFATFYVSIAETFKTDIDKINEANSYIAKALTIFKKYGNDFSDKSFLTINRAIAYNLQYDIQITLYNIEMFGTPYHDFTKINSIYFIDGPLTNAIRLYRESLQMIDLSINKTYEQYNITNNLAQCLSRTGRFIEALDLYESNYTTVRLSFRIKLAGY